MTGVAVAEAAASGGVAPLVVRDVSVSFDGLRVLTDVSIDVRPGEILGLIGPNGAGKTTLFDCISGFVPCTGRTWVAGTEVTNLSTHRRARAGLGRSFQDARLYHSLTVLDTLRVAAELHVRAAPVVLAMAGAPPARRAEDAATQLALEQVEALRLGPYRDKLVGELSTGTRRIVDLACLLVQDPKVVLLDEPSSGIAQKEVEALRPLLLDLRERTDCAIVLIEHDMPLLLGLADRVYALETGMVIAEGPPDEVVHDPEVVRSYLGTDASAIERSSSAKPATKTARKKKAR
jgi:ABC-type branched-subunit amino acid transport system ATPase component